ncbi:MAG: NeuD/PglB/VioB family sugar acetyltransferase [Omnitrophica WOR_2 bacterium]
MTNPVLIPLLNPNEPEARVAALHVKEGQPVSPGDALCTLETTKSAADVSAESQGYIAGLRFQAGQTARAGEILCYISGSPDWTPPEESMVKEASTEGTIPPGLRITQPALAAARASRVDLSSLPKDRLVTESLVHSLAKQPGSLDLTLPEFDFDSNAILIYGGGGHGKMVIDLLRQTMCYRIAGVIDDGQPAGGQILGVPVLGGKDQLERYYRQGIRLAVNAVGGIGNIAVRIRIFHLLAEAGFGFPVLIHPTAFVEPNAELAPGAQIFVKAYIGSQARVGFGTIVNTGSIVSHDCRLGDYVNISPGAILAGEVNVGSGTLIGMGATINLGVQIGAGCRIGNGATVKTDLPDAGVVRAGTIWPAGA